MREFNPHKRRTGSIQSNEPDLLFHVNLKSRRKSCTCTQCGKESEYQIRFHDVQILQWASTSNNNESDNSTQQEIKRLEHLESRLKTCQEDFEKFHLTSKKRRKSCHCSECGNLTQFEVRNQNIPLFKPISIKNCKNSRKVHQLISNINMQTKSQFFRNFKQQNHGLMYQLSNQTSKTTTRLLKQSKLKLPNFESRLSLTPKLANSPLSEQSSPQQPKMNSFDYTLNAVYLNPYLGSSKKFLSPPRNFAPKLPSITQKIKDEQMYQRKSLMRKRD
ncbi:unnamed protein product (macronuclear) [Paramecium tetraurelia]|uniref:Uncharacterized protein n=1 Tax=Paramecium tetraurelia TaxID=5888 RepID=A0C6H4_PARTE|nr:uncharacterized protein GSPATT00035520001 [Paramecium tetraurelia]CAK66391.1 unnamed protein product [Paramecium tetraurelia]|eukprot:XP_001433788.1 hypothetical protein (macronuclear) [Paramecium tetraurelia strain d4-2]